MISVRVNEIVVEIHYFFYIQALFDIIWQVFYVQSILQKLAIWKNNSNSFHRFETEGKKHNQITVTALNNIL